MLSINHPRIPVTIAGRLIEKDGADLPIEADVRLGKSYNSGNKVGTLAVPAKESVAYGVAVDDTVGIAVLTPSEILEEPLASHKGVSDSLAKTLFEINQRFNGVNVVIDNDSGTIKIYDTDSVTLLFTLTKTVVGNVYTISRT